MMLGDRSRWPSLVVVTSIAVVGCFAGSEATNDTGIDDDYMDDPPPPGDCVTDCPTPGSDGSPVGGPCLDSDDCAQNGVCAATFDGEVHAFECRDGCIEAMDDTQWCADDQACCPGTTCSPRGFCVPPSDTEGLDGGSTDPSSTDGSDSTGASTGTSTGGRGTDEGTGTSRGETSTSSTG